MVALLARICQIWDVAGDNETDWKEVKTLSGHGNKVVSVAFSRDGLRLASGSWDGTVKIWDVAGGNETDWNELKTLSGLNVRGLLYGWPPRRQWVI